ncbi:hypothetical protein ACB092_03G062300 [Castanea dentata]
MASSTSILPSASIPLDDQCSNHQLNQKDQVSTIVESSLLQPNTPPPLPPSNWGSTQFMTANPVHLPQQNLSTPPLPPNHGSFHIPMAEPNVAQPQNHVPADQNYIVQFNDPSTLSHQNPSISPPNQDCNTQQSQTISIVIPPSSDQPSPSFTINPQQNHNPATTTVPPNWGSTQYINTGQYPPQQPNRLGLCQYSTAEQNLAQPNPSLPPQNHAPWPLMPPTNQQDSSNTLQAVIAQASEPTQYSLNPPPPCIVMVSAPQPTYYNTYTPPSLLSTPLLNRGSNSMSGQCHSDPSPPPPPSPSPPPEPNQNSNPTNINLNTPQEIPAFDPTNISKPAQSRNDPRKKNVANTAANLANLLPTGTVLVFQALTPSLANSVGKCQVFNKYLIGMVIAFCAATCFLSSFTDSFMVDDKLYYGFATFKYFWVLNNVHDGNNPGDEEKIKEKCKERKIRGIDYVHAFGSLIVFLIFAFSSSDVLHCFFPHGGENQYSMVLYLPLVAGVLSSFLFSICPTERQGFGYADSRRF